MKKFLLVLLIAIPLGFIVIALLGLLQFIGVQYESIWSLVWFYILMKIIEFVLDNIMFLIDEELFDSYFLLIFNNFFAIFLASIFISSVSLSLLSMVVFTAIISLVDFILDIIA